MELKSILVADIQPGESSLSVDDSSGMAQVDFIAHVIVMPIVLSIGMINQCMNVCTLLHLPSGCFMYLKASAIADILSIISFLPFLVRHAELNDTTWEYGMMYHAYIELPLINALITASALNIVAMTVDRYLSVCHPIKFFHATDSKCRNILIILCLYFVAFVIYFPSAWQKKIELVEPEMGTKPRWRIVRNKEVEDQHIFQIYLFVREIICRLGPVVMLVFLNAAIVRSLRKMDKRQSRWGRTSRSQRGGTRGRTSRTPREDRGRIQALLLVTSTTFVICNLPASLLSLFISHINSEFLFWQIFRSVANLLQVTSYLYNFYLYALCSSEYRQAFMRLMGCTKLNSPLSTGDSPTIRFSTHIRRGQIQTVVDMNQVRRDNFEMVPIAEV